MNAADEKAIKQGIEVAERQIAEVDARLAEIKVLNARRTALEAYVAHARNLLGERVENKSTVLYVGAGDGVSANFGELAAVLADAKDPKPIWADAAPILAKARRPMTVPEIVEGMKATGREFGAEHVTEVVRAALNRRADVFENIGKGLYVIKTWPAELKKRPDV